MLTRIVEVRRLMALVVAAATGAWGLHAYPFGSDDVFLALIQIRKPFVFSAFAYGYAALWFTTPFFLMSLLTSVLAILALLGGRFFNWVWLDPMMGIVGALFIAHWSRGLIVSAGAVLLDIVPNQNLVAAIRERLERGDDRVSDLHLWRLGPGHSGLIVTIISERPQPPRSVEERQQEIGPPGKLAFHL